MKAIRLLTNIWFTGILDAINLTFTVCIFMLDMYFNWNDHELAIGTLSFATILQAFYLAEMVMEFVTIRPLKLWNTRKIVYFELFLQVLFIFVLIKTFTKYDFGSERFEKQA